MADNELKPLAEKLLVAVQRLPDIPGSLQLTEITSVLGRVGEAGASNTPGDAEQLVELINVLVGKLPVEELGTLEQFASAAASAGYALEGLDGKVAEALQQSREELAHVAARLLQGLQKAASAGTPVAESVLQETGKLAEVGSELGAEEISKLQEIIEKFAGKLPVEDLEELQKAIAASPATAATLAGASVALGAAAGAAAGAAGIALGAVDVAVPALQEIYDKAEMEKIMGGGFATLHEAYMMSMEDLADATRELQGLGGNACRALCNVGKLLLRVEILRDFMQTMGVIMNNLLNNMRGVAKVAVDIWGRVFGFVTCDLYALIRTETFQKVTIIVAIVLAILCFFLYIFLWCNISGSNALREGHEATSMRDRAKKSRWRTKAVGAVLFICLSAHLPVARTCIAVIACRGDAAESLSSLGGFWDCQGAGIKVLAVLLLVLFALPFPCLCVYQICKNRPRGSLLDANITYDADGEEVAFDNKRYNERIEADPDQVVNPWRSLYKGFERKWAWYKVLQMLIKVVLAFIAIVIPNSTVQAIACSAVLFAFLCTSCCATPFIEPKNDQMDGMGRLSALLSCICALILGLANSDGSDVLGQIIGIILLLLTTLSSCLQIYYVLTSLEPLRRCRDGWLGLLTFKDTTLNSDGLPHQIMPGLDISKEIKHRIWHRFWDGVLLTMCGDEIAARNIELKEETQNHGLAKIKIHWDGERIPEVRDVRVHARQHLEGVDLFWDGEWAKLWIDDYPFQMFVVPDEGGDVKPIIDIAEVQRFVDEQHSASVTAGREVRRRLRAMSMSGARFERPFSRTETETFEDGTETTEDDDGNQTTHPVQSTVSFEVYYTECAVTVSTQDDSKLMAAGFNVSVNYFDGCGDVCLPRTGETKHIANRVCSMPVGHLGISENYQPTADSNEMFETSRHVWEPSLPSVEAGFDAYRQSLIGERAAANNILSSGFWYFVYNNPRLSRDNLQEYLCSKENNEVLATLMDKEQDGLDFLYRRLAFCYRHPAWGTWWCFWDEVWTHNQYMKKISALGEELNPDSASSIAYKPMPREELEAWLDERGLRGSEGRCCCSKWWLGNKALDALYTKMGDAPDDADVKTAAP